MDKKLYQYKVLLGIFTLLFLLSEIINFEFMRGVVTVSFFISSIYLLFSREVNVEKESSLNIPEAHYYQISKGNKYTYILALTFVICTFFFYILTFNTNINIGIISLIAWGITAIVGHITNKMASKNLLIDAISDFIRRKYPSIQVEELQLREAIISIVQTGEFPKSMQSDLGLKIKDLVNQYLVATEQPVTSGEIEEVNKKI